MHHVLPYSDSYLYWYLAYIHEGIFDLRIFIAVPSPYPRDRGITHYLISPHTEVVLTVELHHINPQWMWIHGFHRSLSPAILSTDSSRQCESKRIRLNKLDKARIITLKRNPRRVFEAIYSSKLIPQAIQTLFWDRYMIPQIVPTLLQDWHTISAKQQPMLLKSTHDPTTNLALIPFVTHEATTNEEFTNRDRRFRWEVPTR